MQEWFPVALSKLMNQKHTYTNRVIRVPEKHNIGPTPAPCSSNAEELEAQLPEVKPHTAQPETAQKVEKETYAQTGYVETVEDIYIVEDEDMQQTTTAKVEETENDVEGSTLDDFQGIAGALQIDEVRCDKCDGEHHTEACPKYPLPAEDHPDATIYNEQTQK